MGIAICLTAMIAGTARADGDGQRKLTTAKRTVLAASAAWGAITTLADGSLGLTYQVATPIKGTNTVHVAMVWVRSPDGGRTWSKPVTVVDRRGPDGKRFVRRDDGGMIVYEQRNQALGQLPSGRIICAMAELDYYCDKNGKGEEKNFLGSTFKFKRNVYTWSDDLGATWAPARVLPTGPFGGEHKFKPYYGVSPHWRIVTLEDGTAVMSLYGSIVVTYYSMDPNANDHVGRWSGSKVYTIRFSEEEFIEATQKQ